MYDEEIQNQQAEPTEQESTQVQAAAVQQQEESMQAKNFRMLKEGYERERRERERSERERDEMSRRMAELESRLTATKHDEDDGSDDDLVDKKAFRKGIERERKRFDEELRKQQAKMEAKLAEDRLRLMYPDIETVLSQDNIEAFRNIEPDMARTISSSSDPYGQAVSAYKMIKKLGIYQDPQESAVIQKNLSKPRAAASVAAQQGDSPLTRAHEYGSGLTEERKKQLWKEMQDSMR